MKMKIFILFTLLAVAISCRKEPEAPTGGNKIMIGATTTDTASYLFAKVSTQLSSAGGNQIWQHGHCWSINANPDTSNSHTSLGTIANSGKFTSDLWELSDNIKYFIRPYFTFHGGTIYGAQKEIITLKRGKPVVVTDSAYELTITSVKISGTATFDSGFAIAQKGICWDTAANPTLLKSIGYSEEGAGTGSFVSSITQLTVNRRYYFCAYAVNERGTSYGEIKQINTVAIVLPTVLTSTISEITNNFAACSGNVTNSGNGTVSSRGVCWSTNPNPAMANSYTTSGAGTGVFVSYLADLLPITLYYVRTFATNEVGTAYGNELTFTTLPNPSLPTVTTTVVTNIAQNTATSGGNVTSDGGSNVIARGVCWSATSNPTIANSHTNDGDGAGVFVSNLLSLTTNTLYYLRAFATNNVGTAYGNEVSFRTWACGSSITISHLAGSVAPVTKTVTYGTVTNIPGETSKCWITQNLGASQQATAVSDATEPSAGWYWQFNRKQGYKHTGSALTPAWTITGINENSDWITSNDPCTIELGSGWRIPTSTEWTNVDASGNWTNWNGPWNSSLKMHAAGCLNGSGGSLNGRGTGGYYWSSTQYSAPLGWYLGFYSSNSGMNYSYKAYGFSLRCLRD
ncbi:MAG: hypothetical protein WCP32_16030 [Bacteroidota bacterium]